MSFRTRILLGLLAVVIVPLGALGIAVRTRVSSALASQYEQRVTALVAVIRHDIERQDRGIAERLAAMTSALSADNRFRQGVRAGGSADPYVLDYAADAMRQGGLDMLQIQNRDGRIISSGHFRNEYDLLEPALPRMLAKVPGRVALVSARRPEAPFLALSRLDSVRIGEWVLTVVGGVEVDRSFLDELGSGGEVTVTLALPVDSTSVVSVPDLPADSAIVRRYTVPYIRTAIGDAGEVGTARFEVTHSLAPLMALRRALDLWFAVAIGGAVLFAALIAADLARRISRPLSDLAEQSARLDLERLDVRFASERQDEVGALARVLGAMTNRLRASVRTLRDVERRAALGDLARQVNHDIKNGLIPIRNVFRHLSEVARKDPDGLAAVLQEREGTVRSAVEYLEKLAATYAALYPRLEPSRLDVNSLVSRVAAAAVVPDRVGVELELTDGLPPVRSDELALRRILDNLVTNAVDSLSGDGGRVTVGTGLVSSGQGAAAVRITVADTGQGMTAQELERAFADFHTTKEGGTGLGLSIVRRLVNDLGGTLRVETEPGAGTRFAIDLPAGGGSA